MFNLEHALEALIFAAPEPISLTQLATVFENQGYEISQEEIKQAFENLRQRQTGISIQEALIHMRDALGKVDLCVGHNVSFDKRFMIVEGVRNNIRMNFPLDYCTMKNGKELCKIEITFSNGTKGFKYPKLMELYDHLFPDIPAPQNLHNSLADTIVTLKCYCKMAHNVNLSLDSRQFRLLFRENCC